MLSSPTFARPVVLLFALAAACPAQCEPCQGTHTVTCEFHAALRATMSARQMYFAWADAPCCSLTGVVACKHCLDARQVGKWRPPQRQAHEEYMQKAWYDNSGTVKSIRSLADLVKHLGGDLLTASTSRFFLVTDPAAKSLSRSERKALTDELAAAAELLPGLIEGDARKLDREQWAILWLLRCERLNTAYWRFVGQEDAPSFLRQAPRIEAFVLHDDQARAAFKSFHDGADRILGRIERFTCVAKDDRSDFAGDDLPDDRYGHTMLAYRIGAGLTDRLLRYNNPKSDSKTPYFLEIGLAHALEIATTGKAVFRGSSSESSAVIHDWEVDDWHAKMWRLVGRLRGNRPSKAPTFAQLVAIDRDTARFEHHVAAWSLLTFLQLQPDDGPKKLFEFLLAMRGGAAAADALKQVYGVSGPLLTEVWHRWVSDNRRGIVAPPKGLEAEQAEQVFENFRQVIQARKPPRVSDRDHAAARLAAIRLLRWAPADKAVPELLSILRAPDEFEAMAARETLRSDEMRNEAVAALMLPELEAAVDDANEDRYRRHVVRAVGTLRQWRSRMLPILHRYIRTLDAPSDVLAAAAQTLGEFRDPDSEEPLEAATRSTDPWVRAEAATALAQVSRVRGLSRAMELIKDSSWHVRIASIGIFRRVATWECVPPLIDQLPRENGRLAEDINRALEAITKHEKGYQTVDQWRQWWDNGGRERMKSGAEIARSNTVSGVAEDTFPPIRSKRFMFMIDISKSMSQSVFLKPRAGQTTTSRSGEIQKTKIGFVVEKLVEIIKDPKEIPDDVIFDIALFARTPTLWKRELVPANAANRESAARFLLSESRSQDAVTDLQRALDAGLDMANESLRRAQSHAAVDTIYLVTDGTPTAGEQDVTLLRDWFREQNRNHRIKIYVITVGATDTDLTFLKRLAEENYGPEPRVVRSV